MRSYSAFFFEEGQVYPFTITGQVELPPDKECFLILSSPFNSRHLLKKHPFETYNLEVGKTVLCCIDKINCSGKIFLEPEHPMYKEGEVYDFPIVRRFSLVNSAGNTEHLMVLTDWLQQEIVTNAEGNAVDTNAANLTCRVERIKKGKLFLTSVNQNQPLPQLMVGERYSFSVKEIVTLSDQQEYFVLTDDAQNKHYLRSKFYSDYGFGIGSRLWCLATGPVQHFRHYLEPEHPRYAIGGSYDFIVSGVETHVNEFGNEISHLIVNDGFEKEYFVDCAHITPQNSETGTVIRCRVTDIKMSRLKLKAC